MRRYLGGEQGGRSTSSQKLEIHKKQAAAAQKGWSMLSEQATSRNPIIRVKIREVRGGGRVLCVWTRIRSYPLLEINPSHWFNTLIYYTYWVWPSLILLFISQATAMIWYLGPKENSSLSCALPIRSDLSTIWVASLNTLKIGEYFRLLLRCLFEACLHLLSEEASIVQNSKLMN